MIKIPGSKSYVQTNRSDTLGNLWSTSNVDIQSNVGVMRVSPRLKVVTSSTDDADMGIPVAFRPFGSKYFAIAGTRVFANTKGQPESAYTEDASTSADTDYAVGSDMEVFSAVLCATTTDHLLSLDTATGGTWTDRIALTTGVSHPLAYLKKFDRLYVASNTRAILSMNNAFTAATLGADYTITVANSGPTISCMEATSSYIWIGMMGDSGRRGSIYQWDGISPQITKEYKLDAFGCVALVIDNDIPYAMDTNGALLKFTGSSFMEIGRLPVPNGKMLKNATSTTNTRFIHPNGLTVTKEGTILALINNENYDNGVTINENLPSGIWEWSEDNGFIHRYSFTYNPVAGSTITDFGQNRISDAGAIAIIDDPDPADASRNGTIVAGAKYYTNSSSTASAIFIDDSNDTVRKAGYFVTTKIASQNVQDYWNQLYAKHRRMLNSTDKIVLKYRTQELASPTSISITWVNTTSFTTTTDVSSMVGREVEVLQGTGSGLCAHITAVSGSGTYTVTIDETATGVTTGTALARVQAWTKLPAISNQTKDFAKLPINTDSNWIQLKCYMLWTGKNELEELLLTNKSPSTGVQLQ